MVKEYAAKGYAIVNRDDLKCSVEESHARIEPLLSLHDKIIVDNIHLTPEHRASVVRIAKKLGADISVLHLQTTFEEAQFNACWRTEHGGRHIPAPGLYAAKKTYVEPSLAEGFSSITKVPFKRVLPPEYKNKAVIVDYDGTVRTTKSGAKFPSNPNDIKIIPGISKKLQEYKDNGYLLLGASNQSFVGKGELPEDVCIACFDKTNELLGLDIDYLFSPDAAFPITSYLRKPLPGMGVKHIIKHKLNPAETIMVGDATSDKTFAGRCGFKFIHINQFL